MIDRILNFASVLVLVTVLASLSAGVAVAQDRMAVRYLIAGPEDTAYAITDGGVYLTDDGGTSWGPVPVKPPSPPRGLAVTPNGTIIVWRDLGYTNTSCWNHARRSANGGQTWVDLTFDPAEAFATSIVGGYVLGAHFGSPPQVSGCLPRLARSIDDGATWETVIEFEPFDRGLLTVTARAARAAFVSFDFTGTSPVVPDSSWAVVHRSGDGGATWEAAPTSGAFGTASPEAEPTWPNQSALAPGGALYAWDTEAAELYRLPPSSSVWERVIVPPGTVVVEALDVAASRTLHLGTGAGAFVSTDNGETWTPDGLDGRSVERLTRTEAGVLLALADDEVWRREGPAAWLRSVVPVATEPPALVGGALNLDVYPNPFAELLRLRLTGAAPGPATVVVYDGLGRRVATEAVVIASGVPVEWECDGAALSAGLYVVVVTDAVGRRTSYRVTKS